jgi:hypothetical protein
VSYEELEQQQHVSPEQAKKAEREAKESGQQVRKTPQHDDLPGPHSEAAHFEGEEKPFRPPSQPVQQQPEDPAQDPAEDPSRQPAQEPPGDSSGGNVQPGA